MAKKLMQAPRTLMTLAASLLCIFTTSSAQANSEMTEICKSYAESLQEITEKNKNTSNGNYVISLWDIQSAPINPDTPTTGKPIVASCTSVALWANDGQTFIDYNIEGAEGDENVKIMYLPHGF